MADKLFTDLLAQVENIHNTRDFETLVNTVCSSYYGTDYSSIDFHHDGGMDGYISSSKALIAKHCFEKPVTPEINKNAEILKKARSDLKKAVDLSSSNKIEIKKWIFFTPYNIPGKVFTTLTKEVKKAGFELNCPGPNFITDVLLGNKELLQKHPYLHVIKIDESLQYIAESMEKILTTREEPNIVTKESPKPELQTIIDESKLTSSPFKMSSNKEDSKDFKRLLEIYKHPPSDELEKEIKAIVYSSLDQTAVLQGIHLLVSWYEFSIDTVDDFMVFVNLGIDTSRNLKSLDSEAILLAEKASLLSTKFILMDLEGWGRGEMGNVVGIPLITVQERNLIVVELKKLNTEFNELFKDAMQKSQSSNNYLAVTRTFSIIGSSAGIRAGHFLNLGIKERATLELGVCKSTFMYAKSVAAQFNNESEMVYILYNFANALGFMNESEEALLVLKEVENLAKKHEMSDILGNVERLEKLIKEPKIQLIKNE